MGVLGAERAANAGETGWRIINDSIAGENYILAKNNRNLMSKKTYGIIGLVMLIAAVLVGLSGILPYSFTAAGIYLVGSIAVFLIFVYAFCAKCPVRDNCTHILQGMVTHLMPGRTTGAYSRRDLLGTVVFFGFVALFPQYWLIRNPVLMLVFWILFLGNLVITHFMCCKGCGNIYCLLRYE
jgi:hypothetical protein